MRKTMHKWFWIWDIEKEEEWLNRMAARGLALIGVGFCRYEFEDCAPGEYQIRLEFLESWPCSPEITSYIEFLEDTGAEHVGGFGRWAYFRKKAFAGSFQLFSDYSSRIKYLTRIIVLLALLGGFNLCSGCYNLFLYLCWNTKFNLLGIINMPISLLCFIGIIRLLLKRRQLKDEQRIYE